MRSLLLNLFASPCIIFLSMVTASVPVKAMERHPYPKVVVQEFMSSCISVGRNANPKLLERFCSCAVQVFQDHYTLEQFTAIDKDVDSGKNRSRELNKISSLCFEATLKLNAAKRL